MKDRIIALHGERTMKISAIRSATGPGVFREVLAGKGYRTILEIGTYRGCAAAEMAQYCDWVVTIDLRFGAIEQSQSEFDREAFWRSLGVRNITMHLIDDDYEKKELVDLMDFDFAFIDGAHDAASVRSDFDLVKRCGRVLFHDYDPVNNRKNGVFDIVNALPREQVQPMDGFALWTASA